MRLAVPLAIAAGTGALWLRFHVAPDSMTGPALRTAVQSDLIQYFYPMSQYLARRLGAGELPLWNPHACSGIPLLATMQVAAFHPGSWLALLLPAQQAIAVLMLVECVLGGWFCTLLFREWGCDGFASTAGGLLFVSVCLISYTFWPPAVSTLMWLPWLFLCTEKLARGFSYRWWAGLVAATALQILAGFPQILVYNFELLVPFAMLRLWQGRDRDRPWRSLASRGSVLALAVALGAGIAGAQLLPTLELVANSARQGALSPIEVHYLNWRNAIEPIDVAKRALDPFPRMGTSALGGSDYLGIATLILLAVGIAAEVRSGLTWLLIGMGAAALLLANGYRGWGQALYSIYLQIPVIGPLRTPERMRLMTDFCVICLAVIGFDRLGRTGLSKPDARRMQIAVIGAALLVCTGMWMWGSRGGGWRVAAATGLTLALRQWAHRPDSRAALRALLLVLVFTDLLLATGSFGVLRALPIAVARHYVAEPSLRRMNLEFLRGQIDRAGPGRLGFVDYSPAYVAEPSHGAYRVDCYEPLIPRQWADLHRIITRSANVSTTLQTTDPERFAPFFDVAGVKRVLQPDRDGSPGFAENPDALPRAYLIGSYRVTSRDEAIRHVAAGDVDFQHLVLLDEDPGIADSDLDLQPARITEYTPERVVVEARAPAPAVLVLTDSHYPGWRVRVDGKQRRILLANGLYRAVVVDAGAHQVVFEYRPVSFRAGVALSLTSLGILAGVGIRSSGGGRKLFSAIRRSTPRRS